MVTVTEFTESDQFGDVHVPEDSHDDGTLSLLRPGAFLGSQRPQHRQDVTQAEVIVHLVTTTTSVTTS